MITPATKRLAASRNAALRWSATLQRNGAPLDLTNWVGRLQFREQAGASGSPLLDLGTLIAPTAAGSSLTFPTPSTGAFLLVVQPADWVAFPQSAPAFTTATFAFDLLLTDGGNVTERYIKGSLVLDEGVTR